MSADDQLLRAVARRLFRGDTPAADPAPANPPADNHVPHEGGNPRPHDDPATHATRAWVSELFALDR